MDCFMAKGFALISIKYINLHLSYNITLRNQHLYYRKISFVTTSHIQQNIDKLTTNFIFSALLTEQLSGNLRKRL